MSKDPIKQAMNANIAAMLRPPSEVERTKAKAKAEKYKLAAKAAKDAAKLGTQRVAANQAIDAYERMEELGLSETNPLYQAILAGFTSGVESAAEGVKKVVGEA